MEFRERLSLLLALVTKQELAETIGISPRTIDGWIQGRTPSLSAAKSVAKLHQEKLDKLNHDRTWRGDK